MRDGIEESEGGQRDAFDIEVHRALAREADSTIQHVYSWGGLGAMVLGALPLALAFAQGSVATLTPWLISVTLFLVALFVVRAAAKRAQGRVSGRVRAYCEVNGLDLARFLAHFARRGDYPFLATIASEATP